MTDWIESISEGDKPTFLIIGPAILLATFFLPWMASVEFWIDDGDWRTDDLIIELPSASGWDFIEGESEKMLILAILTIIPAGLFLADKYTGLEQLTIGCFTGIVLLDLAIVLDIIDIMPEEIPIGIGWFLNFIMALFFVYVSYKKYDNLDANQVPENSPSRKITGQNHTYVKNAPKFFPSQKQITIECPGCESQMKVSKLNKIQNVECSECGLAGEIEI